MKYSPYGGRLSSAIKDGYPLDQSVYLFCGYHAWKKARGFAVSRTLLLCLPPWLSPSEFDWPVIGADVLIFDTGNCEVSYIEETAHVLFENGASIVRANMYDNSLIVYK
jgi:hypothetical protein